MLRYSIFYLKFVFSGFPNELNEEIDALYRVSEEVFLFFLKIERMTTISRRLPKTKITRLSALNTAVQKMDSLGGNMMQLSPNTIVRLETIQNLYSAAMQAVNAQRALLASKVAAKNEAKQMARTMITRFIRSFNNGVAIGSFDAGHRAFFGLKTGKEKLPYLGSQQAIIDVGRAIIDGDANRTDLTKGNGAPMILPTIAQVTAAYDDFITRFNETSLLKEALDAAQEAVNALNKEADGVILKVWDEIETFYNEEKTASKRFNARQWGVVYTQIGAKTATINMGFKDEATGEPVQAIAHSAEADLELVANPDGKATASTRYVGTATWTITALGYKSIADSILFAGRGDTVSRVYAMTEDTS